MNVLKDIMKTILAIAITLYVFVQFMHIINALLGRGGY